MANQLLMTNNETILPYDNNLLNLKIFFTKREKDVLKLVVNGYSAKKIGRVLSLSHRTIECYIERVRLKLKCENKTEILMALIKRGLLHELNIL